MTYSIARLLKVASIGICTIVIASFVVFAVQQTKTASGQQQEQLNTEVPGAHAPKTGNSNHRYGAVHKVIDEASNELTSPFAAIVSGSSSEWTIRGVKLLLALLVYGFGLGFLARLMRVRA